MKRIILLIGCVVLNKLYSQTLSCKDIRQMKEIATNSEKYLGEYTGEDDYVHFHHFKSQILPSFAFHSYFEIDSMHDAHGDSVHRSFMFTCLLDTFPSESAGSRIYKKLKGRIRSCLGMKFSCTQYKEDPFQLWCFGDYHSLVMGMKYEHPYGNVLFIEYSYTIGLLRNRTD